MKSQNKATKPIFRKKQTKTRLNSASFICAAALSFSALADESAVKHYNIPAQSLQNALNQFSAASDMQMSYPAALAAGVKTPGVSGQYTKKQALKLLLQGSGLVPKVIDNTVTIKQPDSSALTRSQFVSSR